MSLSVRQCFVDPASGRGQRERRRKGSISHRVATTNKKHICSVLNRFNENHAKKELVPTTTSSEMLMPALVGRGNPSSSCVQAEAMGGKGSSWPRKNI